MREIFLLESLKESRLLNMIKLKKYLIIFHHELILAINNIQIPFILGNQDISARYKRSKIGAFWITINLLVFIITLSIVFGHLFQNRIEVILPMLATGLIAWNFLSSLILESSKAFVDSGPLILQTNTPILAHLFRVWWRNIIIFFHNILIVPILYLFFDIEFSSHLLMFIPYFFLFNMLLIGPCIVFAILCSRFRDISNILNNLLQIGFYLTPILWSLDNLNSEKVKLFIYLNPFYYPVTLIQKSLLSLPVDIEIILISLLLSLLGIFFSAIFFGIYKKRIAFWL